MIRSIAGIAAGALIWWTIFFLAVGILYYTWPAYAESFDAYQISNDYNSFTTITISSHLVIFLFCSIAAGWMTSFITKQQRPAWYLATILLAYASYIHLYLLWNILPYWYNLSVVIPVLPLIIIGSKMNKSG